MPARTARGAGRATIVRTGTADGLMLAPIRPRGRWAALRALHRGMHELRGEGMQPVLSFVIALAQDGRIVPGRDPEASIFLLGYRAG
jgi:hypothetical protein